jgi:hypothetical protein
MERNVAYTENGKPFVVIIPDDVDCLVAVAPNGTMRELRQLRRRGTELEQAGINRSVSELDNIAPDTPIFYSNIRD